MELNSFTANFGSSPILVWVRTPIQEETWSHFGKNPTTSTHSLSASSYRNTSPGSNSVARQLLKLSRKLNLGPNLGTASSAAC